jgi:hypothetical protein
MKLGRRDPSNSPIHNAILGHYRSAFGVQKMEDIHWTPGPISSVLPDLHIAKTRWRGMWVFATIGAWRATEESPNGLEFVAVARKDDASVLLRLGMIAYYQAGGPSFQLGVGHTVSIGEGWVAGSPLEAVLISLPYLWGPSLEHCQLSGHHVQVLWVIPIHESERAFAIAEGLDALEQRFEETSFDYLDPFRPSVVPGPASSAPGGQGSS